jgi:hypothetical protein
MKLPNGDKAYIPKNKLMDYLLSVNHPVGAAKAVFFRGLGFDETNQASLERELLDIARNAEIVETEITFHGHKYVLEGILHSPSGLPRLIRSVWIVEHNRTEPRFVTAYPQ